jgi:hypothetical protein
MGPISARFTGRVTLSNLNPPISYTIEGEGVGGVAGFAKGGVDVSLAEVGQETLLPYTVKADVGGKVEQFGARLINATAKESGWSILRPILRTDCKEPASLMANRAELFRDSKIHRRIPAGAVRTGVTSADLTYSRREYPNWILVDSDSGFADGQGRQKETSER